ncbi:MAG: adenylate/guanylate cyclase domain-containing protein, partial [Gammaproteobacteria bacterium]|nr:adenylate/guanylate cyclase domain-containing protein [Gammaproteobacteria bacterium]
MKAALGMPDEQSLPEHILSKVRDSQDASEMLIGWIQIGVLTVFTLLYFASPKTYPDSEFVNLVPYVLIAYFCATVARLYLAWRRKLPNFVLYVSIVIDIVLLYGLIWSFHLQYMQPAAFYLKAPTLLYVFIFIALRALRFQVRYVAATGMVAAVGWIMLAWYAISAKTINSPITNNYIDYLTSNSVLLGAEVDKVISILLVTLTLMVALARARSLMIRSILEKNAAKDLSRFVPAAVAAQVSDGHSRTEAGDRERQEATVLFVDIEGFTSFVETLEPEAVIEILNQYFAVVGQLIEEQGGVINQFQGDAILASFNVPEPRVRHAAAAVRAGLAIVSVAKHHRYVGNRTLNVRVGICTGTLVGGIVGFGSRLSYTVHG